MNKRLLFSLIFLAGLTLALSLSTPAQTTAQEADRSVQLTLTFEVINDHNGPNLANDFALSIHVAPELVSEEGVPFLGKLQDVTGELNLEIVEESETRLVVQTAMPAGLYRIYVSGPDIYDISYAGDCSGTVASGTNIACTARADDKPVEMHLVKWVVGEGGERPEDFSILVANRSPDGVDQYEFPGSEEGVLLDLASDRYFVTETAEAAIQYSTTMSEDCMAITDIPANGERVTCLVINQHTNQYALKALGVDPTCTGSSINWAPSTFTFHVPEVPGTDGPVDAKMEGGEFTMHSDTWAFNYGKMRMPRVGDSQGRFGAKVIGYITNGEAQRFPLNTWHEWRVAVLAMDTLALRYDGFGNGNCVASVYYVLTANEIAPEHLQVELGRIRQARAGEDGDAATIQLTLEDYILAAMAAQRRLYAGIPILTPDLAGDQPALLTIEPFGEQWNQRINWIAGQNITGTEPELPEKVNDPAPSQAEPAQGNSE
jgi:hypothetical protein